MTLRVTFLGAGGSTFTKTRGALGLLINDDLLIDCGDGITQKLVKIGSINSIKTICITHLHCDHYIGIFSLLWHYWILNRKEDLKVIGPIGLKDTIETILTLIHSAEDMPTCKIIYEEFEDSDEIFSIKSDYDIKGIKMAHYPLTFAYRIKDKESDKVICYSGDYKPNENLKLLAKDCDLLISEATFPNSLADMAHKHNHSTSVDAALIAQETNCKKLALVHISAVFERQLKKMETEASSFFGKEIILPEDFTVVEV